MNITILKPVGYCFGVINAINIVFKAKEKYSDKNIKVFGELVHSKKVIEELEKNNIEIVESKEDALYGLNNDDILIFPAHGHNKKYNEILKNRGIKFFDTTCPKVLNNFKFIEENNDKKIIFIGKKEHPETIAALSYSKNIFLYDIKEGLDLNLFDKNEEIYILNQTTLSVLELKSIYDKLSSYFTNLKFHDEICNVARIRQENIINLDKKYDLILIVGSKTSSNTTKLFDLAKFYHGDKKILMIDSEEELMDIDLSNYKEVVITSGTSTSEKIINEIKIYLEETYNETRRV